MSIRVMIIGAGRVGSALAERLEGLGHDIVVIEQQADRRDWLAGRAHFEVAVGDGTDPHVLETHGIRACDALVAVTDHDATNVLVATLAKVEFGVPRTVTRIVDPGCSWLHTPAMGVDVTLEQASLIAELVAEKVTEPTP